MTARLGYTFGRAVFYAQGRLGLWGGQGRGEHDPVPGIAPAVDHGSATIWVNGWTAGGGMEYAFTDRWSVKAEYMHFELGEKAFNLDWMGRTKHASASGDSVQVGVNYHLGELK